MDNKEREARILELIRVAVDASFDCGAFDDSVESPMDALAAYTAISDKATLAEVEARTLVGEVFAQLDAALRDSARLDWLESMEVETIYFREQPGQLNPMGQSLRSAIDDSSHIGASSASLSQQGSGE